MPTKIVQSPVSPSLRSQVWCSDPTDLREVEEIFGLVPSFHVRDRPRLEFFTGPEGTFVVESDRHGRPVGAVMLRRSERRDSPPMKPATRSRRRTLPTPPAIATPPLAEGDALLTTAEAAERCSVGASALRKAKHENRIESVGTGPRGTLLWSRSSLDRLAGRLPAAAGGSGTGGDAAPGSAVVKVDVVVVVDTSGAADLAAATDAEPGAPAAQTCIAALVGRCQCTDDVGAPAAGSHEVDCREVDGPSRGLEPHAPSDVLPDEPAAEGGWQVGIALAPKRSADCAPTIRRWRTLAPILAHLVQSGARPLVYALPVPFGRLGLSALKRV